jgi:hypothetical protein
MSVAGYLEEMLLHTNDGAGPHTKTTLASITTPTPAIVLSRTELAVQSPHNNERVRRYAASNAEGNE